MEPIKYWDGFVSFVLLRVFVIFVLFGVFAQFVLFMLIVMFALCVLFAMCMLFAPFCEVLKCFLLNFLPYFRTLYSFCTLKRGRSGY